MQSANLIWIICGVAGAVFVAAMVILFWVSRKSQRVMQSMLDIMTRPERARVADAVRVLNMIMADEMAKIQSCFQNIRDTLASQIDAVNDLEQKLGAHNTKLVTTANDAAKSVAQMSQRLDNTVTDLHTVVNSPGWSDVEMATDRFSATVNDLMAKIDVTAQDTTERATQIQEKIESWIGAGEKLSQKLRDEFESNTGQMQTVSTEYENMVQKISELTQATATGFDNVKSAATGYEDIMDQNNKMLDGHLEKMDTFSKQAKKQLANQMNTLTNTANVVGAQVRLAESSIDKQVQKLGTAVETLMSSATSTEGAVRNISTELATLTNRFNSEIKDFATGVVSELKTVSGVANTTLENTKTAAGAFSESVRAMATGVRETLIEMNTAHTQLSGQSENLIKMSAETTAQLQPLSELIEKYFTALPDLARDSVETGDRLQGIVASLNEKIDLMRVAVAESTSTVAESAAKLEDLAGQSRQQMIDLMSDYAKAVNTMQTLNKQMMVARATAPMDAINTTPTATFGRVSAQDFLKQSERMFEKLHEQTLDLTRATGAEIPDVVWKMTRQYFQNGWPR